MFVLAVFGFRAFSDLSKFNELNQKHKWNISLVLIFGSYKSRASPTQWQLHNSHPTATLPKPLGCSSAPLQTSSENSFGVCYFSGASSHFTCKRASPPLPHNPTAAWNHHNSKASCSYDTSAHKNKAPEEPQVRPDSSPHPVSAFHSFGYLLPFLWKGSECLFALSEDKDLILDTPQDVNKVICQGTWHDFLAYEKQGGIKNQ